jgi:hypothetical protein
MNKKRPLLVAMLLAIGAAATGGIVAPSAHATWTREEKIVIYQTCRDGGGDPESCCNVVGGVFTQYVGTDGLTYTQCVIADSPGGNNSNLAAASPPFQRSLNGPTISVTQSNAGLYGVVQISETINTVIP